ncbi:hypothetical protein ACFXD5_35145 [Streptomyces sp. NPDC059385]|uniref:hypothetical protein n=1 Tax=Streptomyces sp. NPDC059385 TaxID=3346817 RepID=UPI0036C98D33
MRPQPGYTDHDTLELPHIRVDASGAPEAPGGPGAPGAPGTPRSRPVFVDSSGRRQQRVRRLGWLLVVPAVAYVVLVLSSLFGGPTLRSPFLPAPRGVDAAPSKPPAAEPRPSASPVPRRSVVPVGGASRAPAPTAPAKPTAGTGSGSGTETGSGTAPTSRPSWAGNGNTQGTGSNGHGKPTAPPGQGGGKPGDKQ